ncbi:MAG: sulfite exporter TauE/SafE family protein, partial [Roseobacter sp.]
MTGHSILFLVLGAVAGGFINGLAGTGTALFALGFYLVVLDPVRAVAIVAFMSVLAGLQGLWIVRAEIFGQPRRLLRFLLPGLLGV